MQRHVSVSEGEEHDAKLGCLQKRAAHDAGGGNLHRVGELERLRIVSGKESLMTRKHWHSMKRKRMLYWNNVLIIKRSYGFVFVRGSRVYSAIH